MKKFFVLFILCFSTIFLTACTTQEEDYNRQDSLLTPEAAEEFGVIMPQEPTPQETSNQETLNQDAETQSDAPTQETTEQNSLTQDATAQSSTLHDAFDPSTIDSDAIVSTDVDIDLTQMSSTLVYAQVYDLLVNTDAYVGQTIRMSGTYNSFDYELTGESLHFVVIADATACCAQGLEFYLPEDAEYANNGDEVEVVGTITKLQEVRGDEVYDYLSVEGKTITTVA